MKLVAFMASCMLISTTSALAFLYPSSGDVCVTNDRAVFTMSAFDHDRLREIRRSGDDVAYQSFVRQGRVGILPQGTEVFILEGEYGTYQVRPRGTTQSVYMDNFGFASCRDAKERTPPAPEKPAKEKKPKRSG